MAQHTGRIHANNPGRGKLGSALWDAHSAEDESPRTIAKECGPVVYAAQLKNGIIKIGYTRDIADRLSHLGCGLSGLLALKPGTYADEQVVHSALQDHRHHGREYYYPTPAVMAVVNDMRATFGLAPVTPTSSRASSPNA